MTAQQSSEAKSQPIGYWTGKAYRHIAAAIRASLAEEGLTQPQWWMLHHAAKGDWTPDALLDKLAPVNANEQNLSLVHELDDLIERGWLTREPRDRAADPHRAGRGSSTADVGPQRCKPHRRMIAGVNEAEYDVCITVLQRIVANPGGDPSPH